MADTGLRERDDELSDSLNPAELKKQEQSVPPEERAPGEEQDRIDDQFDDIIGANYGDEGASSTKTKDDGAESSKEPAGDGAKGAAGAGVAALAGEHAMPGAKQTGKLKGARGFFKKHKKAFIFGAAGGSGALTLLVLAIFLASALFLPNFFQSMMAYGLATSTRNFRQANEQILARKLANDAMSDAEYAPWNKQFSGFRSSVLLKNYRPTKIVANMKRTGALNFVESAPEGIFKRTRITAIVVNGKVIPITDPGRFTPIQNATNGLRMAAEIDAALASSERGAIGTFGTMIRTSVSSEILQRIGVRGLWAWLNKGKGFSGLSPQQADLEQQFEAAARVKDVNKPKTPALTEPVEEAAEKAAAEREAEIAAKGPDAIAMLEDEGADTAKVRNIMVKILDGVNLNTVLSFASTTYGILVPACMILDSSMSHSGDSINAKKDAMQNEFMLVGSGVSQLQSGDTTGEAAGALTRKFNGKGEYAHSSLYKMSSGGAPDTTLNTGPVDASVAGDYSFLTAFLPAGAEQVVNGGIEGICPTLTSWQAGLTTAGIELVLGFFTGGASEGAAKLGTAGVVKAFSLYTAKAARSLATKVALKRIVRNTAITGGLSLLAAAIAHEHSGSVTGTARGAPAIDETTGGAYAMNQSLNQQVLAGRAMTPAEAAQNDQADRTDIQNQTYALSPFNRYLALSNPTSLLSRLAITVGSSINMSLVQSFLGMIGNVLNPVHFASLLTGPFGSKAGAAAGAGAGAFGVMPIGFSQAELKLIETRATYWDITANDDVLYNHNASATADIENDYSKCLTTDIGTQLANGWIERDTSGGVIADKGDCSPNRMGRPLNSDAILAGNGTVNPQFASPTAGLVFRWRVSKRATNVLISQDEVSNPGQNFGDAAAAPANGPVSTQGDPKLIAQSILDNAKKGFIDLTANAKSDLTTQAAGHDIGTCGLKSLSPITLNVILKLSTPDPGADAPKYKVSINNFVTGHECDFGGNGPHPLGKAADIQSFQVNGRTTENWDTCGFSQEDLARAPCGSAGPDGTAFVQYLASIMPDGMRMGQETCFDRKAAGVPSRIKSFPDTCHHIHIDSLFMK